ncbi:hypothetical protein ADM96_04585 [Burkholderia sp. ST111]|nr:hypothetical protein ADM96_04585 [Burkholderia sp. ST111]
MVERNAQRHRFLSHQIEWIDDLRITELAPRHPPTLGSQVHSECGINANDTTAEIPYLASEITILLPAIENKALIKAEACNAAGSKRHIAPVGSTRRSCNQSFRGFTRPGQDSPSFFERITRPMDAICEYRSGNAGDRGIAIQDFEDFRNPCAMHQEIIVQEDHDVEVVRHMIQCGIALRGTARLPLDHEHSGLACKVANILIRYARDNDQIRLDSLQIDEGDDMLKELGTAPRGEDQANF